MNPWVEHPTADGGVCTAEAPCTDCKQRFADTIVTGAVISHSLPRPYTDEALIASAREYAFNGLMMAVALGGWTRGSEFKKTLIRHFTNALALIDGRPHDDEAADRPNDDPEPAGAPTEPGVG
jgi:hypothetical protein